MQKYCERLEHALAACVFAMDAVRSRLGSAGDDNTEILANEIRSGTRYEIILSLGDTGSDTAPQPMRPKVDESLSPLKLKLSSLSSCNRAG